MMSYLDAVPLPSMVRVRQHFPADHVSDVQAAVRKELERLDVAGQIRPGMRVGVGIGSRGVAEIACIAAATVAYVRDAGAEPLVIPAMGSHGGATPAGQEEVLAQLGVTPQSVGAPILSSMETRQIETLDDGTPVYLAQTALEMDALIVVNRIKPHTSSYAKYPERYCSPLWIASRDDRGDTEAARSVGENSATSCDV